MPSEVVLDTTLGEITPRPGKAPLDTWRSLARPGLSAGVAEPLNRGLVPQCKPWLRGVDTCQRLSLLTLGKAVGGQARVRTGLGKSDRPGS